MREVNIISSVVGRDNVGKSVGSTAPSMGAYALKSDLSALQSMFNDFLEGDDTDSVINRWKDLEAFLNGISEDNTLSSILGDYIPIQGYTDILGEKNFTGGLKVNGSPITYNSTDKYWKLEGDLLVTGGITMYGNDSDFVASTIMDAIVADNTNLKVVDGVLTFVGSTGGASTLGELSNVGSWANSVASQDRIMYQAANSSMWVAKNLSDLAVGGVTGDYLPLSGGIMSGYIGLPNGTGISNGDTYTLLGLNSDGSMFTLGHDAVDVRLMGNTLTIHTRGDTLKHYNIQTGVTSTILDSTNYSSYALPLVGGTLSNGKNTPLAIKGIADGSWISYVNQNDDHVGSIGFKSDHQPYAYHADYGACKIWHAGNDGSGSGLDADLLDGYDSSYIMKYGGNWTASTDTAGIFAFGFGGSSVGFANNYGAGIQLCNAQGITAKPSSNNNDSNWYSQLLFGTDNRVYARFNTNGRGWSGQYKIAYTSDNIASATKLFTARTIWGQSFDGTGDISGSCLISGTLTTQQAWSDGASIYIKDTRTNGAGGYQAIRFYSGGTEYGVIHGFFNSYNGHSWTNDNVNIGATYITLGDWDNPTMLVQRSATGGNVGIGTTNPREKLEVSNYALIGGNIIVGGGAIGFNRNTYEGGRYDTNYQGWQIDIGGNTLNFYTEGSLGSGNKVKFDASGNILATGGVTMYSDSRKKTILNHVVLSLQQIANAPLIEHYYNSDQNKITHVGSIAQYWAEMNDWFCKKDSEGFYTMEIQNAALASAISIARELDRYENKTDKKIKQLKKRISQLEDEIERLKTL